MTHLVEWCVEACMLKEGAHVGRWPIEGHTPAHHEAHVVERLPGDEMGIMKSAKAEVRG
jgi:hypothetical protein